MLIKRFTPSRESVATAMKRLSVMLVLCFLLGAAHAGTFSANGGQGESTVGSTGCDYSTLAAAAADFSGYAGGCTGNWTLLIKSNLTEPNNLAFGNATNGYNVTVKPDTGITAQIEFTAATANPSGTWPGIWLIGTSSISNPLDNMTPTNNFTIDGSNNGTTSRDLTILGPTASIEAEVIRIVGGCQNTTIKNAIIVGRAPSGLNAPIDISARKTTGDVDHVADGVHIDNCDISCMVGTNTQNILFRQVSASGKKITDGTAIDNVTITNNTLTGIQNNINLGFCASVTVTDNIMSSTAKYNNRVPVGVQHNSPNGTDGWTVNIERNRFVLWDQEQNIANGLGPMVDVGVAASNAIPTTGTYNINNNFFAGFQYNTPNTAEAGSYKAIQLVVSVPSYMADVHIYHNSFNMPNVLPNTFVNQANRYQAIGVHSDHGGVVDVKDNIFVLEQNNAVVFYRSSAAGSVEITSDYNTFCLDTGASLACYKNGTTPNYTSLAEWQVAGFDTHSLIADPRVAPTPEIGKWVSSTNLHFDPTASDIFSGVDVGIATDIDGEARVVPVIGADEVPVLTPMNAHGWEIYQ